MQSARARWRRALPGGRLTFFAVGSGTDGGHRAGRKFHGFGGPTGCRAERHAHLRETQGRKYLCFRRERCRFKEERKDELSCRMTGRAHGAVRRGCLGRVAACLLRRFLSLPESAGQRATLSAGMHGADGSRLAMLCLVERYGQWRPEDCRQEQQTHHASHDKDDSTRDSLQAKPL